tara:strand:+ start:546 stop:659 length:114 start_codon:yes stop_codon:yes gene_type:complete
MEKSREYPLFKILEKNSAWVQSSVLQMVILKAAEYSA